MTLATATPAFVGTSSATGCFVYDWNSLSSGTSVAGTPLALTPLSGATGSLSMTVSSVSTSGVTTPQNMTVNHQATDQVGDVVGIPALSTSNLALVLNQALPGAKQTITFDFGTAQVTSVSFALYDVTYVTNTYLQNVYRYQDAITFNMNASLTGDTTSLNRTAPTAGTRFYRTSAMDSSVAHMMQVSAASTGQSTFSMVYENMYTGSTNTTYATRNAQFVAIGDLTVCL